VLTVITRRWRFYVDVFQRLVTCILSSKSDSRYEKFNCRIVTVQWLTFVFGVIEILDLNVGPKTALTIRVFCSARSVKQMASGMLHALSVILSSFHPSLLNRAGIAQSVQ